MDAASVTTATMETFATVFELGRKSCAIQEFENAPIGDYKQLETKNVRFGENSSGLGVKNWNGLPIGHIYVLVICFDA